MTLAAISAKIASRKSCRPDWYCQAEPVKNDWTWYFWFVMWWLYGALQLYKVKWLPIPYHWGRKSLAVRYLNQAIRDKQTYLYGAVSVSGDKGGVGKTTHSTWLTAHFSLVSGNPALLIDTDSGAEGDAAHRFDIESSQTKYSLDHVIPLILNGKWQPNLPQMVQYVPRHRQSGAFVIAPGGKLTTTTSQMQQVIRAFRKPISLVVLDSTPGVKESNNESLLREASVSILSALDKQSSYDRHIVRFRDRMNADHLNAFEDGIRSGKQFIVIGDVPRHRFNLRYQYEVAERLDVPAEQLILLPRSKHIQNEGTVDISRVSKLFLFSITLFAHRVAIALEAHNQEHPIDEPTLQTRSVTERTLKEHTRKLLAEVGGPDELAQLMEKITDEDARPGYTKL